MKRVLFVALLATAMLIAMAVPAVANDVVMKKLTVTCYFDADGDACWDCSEPVLPGVMVGLWDGYQAHYRGTDGCGRFTIWFPYGSEVRGYVAYMLDPWPISWKQTEATPAWWKDPAAANVKLYGNRCMLFGVAPDPGQ